MAARKRIFLGWEKIPDTEKRRVVKFRYTFHNKETDEVFTRILTLDEIEQGYAQVYDVLLREQFTDHKDKNGVEIFEGDEVSWTSSFGSASGTIRGIVSWKKGRFMVEQTTECILEYRTDFSFMEHALCFYSFEGKEFFWDCLEVIRREEE